MANILSRWPIWTALAGKPPGWIVTGTEPLNIDSKDEVGALAAAINGIIAQTQKTVAAFEQAIATLRNLIELDGGAALRAAADKDLTARTKKEYQGEYDAMKKNINALIQNLDEALVQASAAEELSGQAEEMKSMVAAFHLTNAGNGGTRQRSPRKPSQFVAPAPHSGHVRKSPPAKPSGNTKVDAAAMIPLDETDQVTLGEF
jgi:hypothetical protein